MLKNFKYKIIKKPQILILIILIFITTISTAFFNYKKDIIEQNNDSFFNNVYLKKTLNHIIDNLEPKYKKFDHKIKSGETFDKILKNYSIDQEEINKIKKNLKKKVNINKLNTKQKIWFSLDQTTNKIKEFTFQISNTKKIYLTKNDENDRFNQKILSIKLNKKISKK